MRWAMMMAGAMALTACGEQDASEIAMDDAPATSDAAGTAQPATAGEPMADAGSQTGERAAQSGGESADGSISMEEAARRAAGIAKPQPGKYRASVEIVDVSMPGAPPQVVEQMKQMQARGSQSREFCLTPEQAQKGFAEMVRQANSSEACTFSRFDVKGERIDAEMTCSRPGQGTGRMTMQGTGRRTSSDITTRMNIEAPGGNTMTMTMRSQQQRIGDC